MNLLFWKINSVIDKFSILIADEFFSHIQPEMAEIYIGQKTHATKKEAHKANKAVEAALNATISQITDFCKSNKPGVYGKARLHMKFMERLKALGYSESSAQAINEILMLRTP